GRLPGAAAADEGEDFSLLDGELEMVEDRRAAGPVEADVAKFNGGHRHGRAHLRTETAGGGPARRLTGCSSSVRTRYRRRSAPRRPPKNEISPTKPYLKREAPDAAVLPHALAGCHTPRVGARVGPDRLVRRRA